MGNECWLWGESLG